MALAVGILGASGLPASGAAAPELSIGSVAVTEGDGGARPAKLTVGLSSPLGVDTFVQYAVVDGSAMRGVDFVRRPGRVRIRAGRTSATIGARVLPDLAAEGDETFAVVLTTSDQATIAHPTGTVTIVDDDPSPGGARLAIGDVAAYEGDAAAIPLRFTVSLDSPQASDVTGRFTGVAGSASTTDVALRSKPFRIRAGRTSTVLAFSTKGDTEVEPAESFTVVLTSVVGAALADGTGTGTVLDDDLPLVTVPGPPSLTSVEAGPANGMLAVNWSPPASDGGSPLTGYDLEVTRPADVVVGRYTGTGANVTCGGPGVTCTLRVRAVNAVGPGPWSDPLDGTTWRAPSAVQDLVLHRGAQALSASWSLPADPGDFTIVGYRVERSSDGDTFTFVESTTSRASSISCPGEGATCWVRVRAQSSAGFGPAVETSATTFARPGAPTLVSARRVGTAVGLGWTPPADDGGTAINDYTGERSTDGGGTWLPVGSVQATPPTCPSGVSCSFRVTAVNVVGAGPPSNVLTVGP